MLTHPVPHGDDLVRASPETPQAASFDAKQFRSVMGRFASGVTIVGYLRAGEPAGLTATAFISVSLKPPLVLVSVRAESRFLASVPVGTRFCISFLNHDQRAVSDHFGGRPTDPGPRPFELWQSVPAVTDAVAGLAVCATDIYPAGDHRLVIAEVEQMFHTERKPLLFFGGRYGRLALEGLERELAGEMATEMQARENPSADTSMAH
ncbi:MAG: flavin reductase family protein [Bradyrhizobium sp.]|nr:flavin reductase family protein [Bradyrhizobium sp.]